jgi:hypothetical protein
VSYAVLVDSGQVVGLLLDEHRWTGGSYVLNAADPDGVSDRYSVAFMRPHRWRIEHAGQLTICDGKEVAYLKDGLLARTRAARLDQVLIPLKPAYPLALPIWGRGGDDFRIGPVERVSADDVTVRLIAANPDYRDGRLMFDIRAGFLRHVDLVSHSYAVEGLDDRWPGDEEFRW